MKLFHVAWSESGSHGDLFEANDERQAIKLFIDFCLSHFDEDTVEQFRTHVFWTHEYIDSQEFSGLKVKLKGKIWDTRTDEYKVLKKMPPHGRPQLSKAKK